MSSKSNITKKLANWGRSPDSNASDENQSLNRRSSDNADMTVQLGTKLLRLNLRHVFYLVVMMFISAQLTFDILVAKNEPIVEVFNDEASGLFSDTTSLDDIPADDNLQEIDPTRRDRRGL